MIKFVFYIILNSLLNRLVLSQNECTFDRIEIPVWPRRVILRYQCSSEYYFYPTIPNTYGSDRSEYNELDLSPNLFTEVPYNEICQFSNIYKLDLSYNKITNSSNLSKSLSCLLSLNDFDLSYNQISSPLVGTDFDEILSNRLRSLNLNNNRIPAIETEVFIRPDGFGRFPNLKYLGLANNQIKSIDLLSLMTIHSIDLKVELNNNSINSLINPQRRSYSEQIFMPMTGSRSVDLKFNSLTRLDDTNLLQYGLQSANDFLIFLFKLSNYDFGKNTSRLSCICPPQTGLYTVFWFKNFSRSISDLSAPIYNLFCSGNPTVNIFNFTCTFIGTTSTTTRTTTTTTTTIRTTTTRLTTSTTTTTTSTTSTTTTTTTTTTTSTTTTSTNKAISTSSIFINSFGQLLNENSTLANQIDSQRLDLIYLVFLIIPLIILIFVLFLCCFGRFCSLCCFNSCSSRMCQCIKPDNNKTNEPKTHDLTICFNDYEELWLNKNFIPNLNLINKNFKTNRVKNISDSNFDLNHEQIVNMKKSKRILLFFTRKFVENEWACKGFRDLIQDISQNDSNCVVIALCVGDLTRKQVRQHIKEIQTKNGFVSKLKHKLVSNVQYNIGLNKIEYLEYNKTSFWEKLAYLTPDVPTPRNIVIKQEQVIQEPKYEIIRNESPTSSEATDTNLIERRPSYVIENELPLITKLKKTIDDTKTKAMKTIESNKVYPINDVEEDLVIKDDGFWSTLLTETPQGLNYEPVGQAGSSVKGNQKSNLNRFGYPIYNDLRNVPILYNRNDENNSDINVPRPLTGLSNRILIPKMMADKLKSPRSARSARDPSPRVVQNEINDSEYTFKVTQSVKDDEKELDTSNDYAEVTKNQNLYKTDNISGKKKAKKSVVISTELNSENYYTVDYPSDEEIKKVEKKKKKNKDKIVKKNKDNSENNDEFF